MCCRSLDVDLAVSLCLRYRLYSAFTHVANRGLRDFTLPVDVLLAAIATCDVMGALHKAEGLRDTMVSRPASVGFDYQGGSSSEARSVLVRKLLLYLACCVTGRSFPFGSLLDPDASTFALTVGASPGLFFTGVLAAETGAASLLPPLLPFALRVGERS